MLVVCACFTKTDYDRTPEGFPAQLIGGSLVREPGPTYGHQNVQMRIIAKLLPLGPRGCLVAGPADVLIDRFNVYQPDVLVLREIPPRGDHYVGTPLIAIEVLSPRTARRDRTVKARRLLEIGVDEVWLVDPAERCVELRNRHGAQVAFGEQVVESAAVAGFALQPDRLFAD